MRSQLRNFFMLLAAASLSGAVSHGQAATEEVPEANPARPTVSTPATLTPVGYLQFENGVFYANASPEVAEQWSIGQVTKLTVTPRLQFFGIFGPYVNSAGALGDGVNGNQPGSISAGVQGVAIAGEGSRPTIALSYIKTFYSGQAPDIDIGSSTQNAIVLWSEDLGHFHVDTNGIVGEQTQGRIRRAQFGQTLSISHPLGPSFTLSGELWHFSQPLARGNAVGNLWSLSYAVRKNLVLDGGFDHGLTSSSTQWEGFGGFTYLLPKRLWKAHAHS